MKHLHISLFLVSVLGGFLTGNCVYLSNQVAQAICEQHGQFVSSGVLQKPAKSPSDSGSKNTNGVCGWYQVRNGQNARKEATCPHARVSDLIECNIMEQRRAVPPYNPCKNRTRNGGEEEVEGSGRILGGEPATPHEFPSILIDYSGDNGDRPYCAGAIIHPEWAVTARHCIGPSSAWENSTFNLVAGAHYNNKSDEQDPARQTRKVVEFFEHELWNKTTLTHDIALMRVSPPFEMNEFVQPAIVPPSDYTGEGDLFTVVGWGAFNDCDPPTSPYESFVPYKVQIPYFDDAACKEAYAQLNYPVDESEICAGYPEGGKDSCGGDSGGPLYKIDGDKQILAGITSWGTDCGRPGFPGVYVDMAYMREWIKERACIDM